MGTHDRDTQEPVPEHISARPQNLTDLLDGIIKYDGRSIAGVRILLLLLPPSRSDSCTSIRSPIAMAGSIGG